MLLPRSIAAALLALTGCANGLVLAPHRARESEVGPASAEGRHAMVLERATAFEQSSAKSRDVYWYRVWRASAMVGVGQIDEGDALADSVLAELASPPSPPPDIGRLKMFAYDVRARAALARQQPAQALAMLDRAMSFAIDSSPTTGDRCDGDLALAARTRQIAEVAAQAGDGDRAGRARGQLERKLEDWAICMAKKDYPSLGPLLAMKGAISPPGSVVVAAASPPVGNAAAPNAVLAAAPPPAPAAPPSGLRTASIRYGPIDTTPYRAAIDNLLPLLEKGHKGAKADAQIRIDGSRRALRIRIQTAKPEAPSAVVAIFKSTVVFFEQTRDLSPKLEEVLVAIETPQGTTQLVAAKSDVFDLFVDRLDEPSFLRRVVEVR